VALNLQTAFLSPPVAMAAFLSEGGGAAARDAEPDLHRDDAVHGDPVFGDIFALPLPQIGLWVPSLVYK